MASSTVVQLKSKPHAYTITIGQGLLAQAGHYVQQWIPNAGRILVVSDTMVWPRFGQTVTQALELSGFMVKSVLLAPGEAHKTLDSLTQLYDEAMNFSLKRRDGVIALGGGIIGDMTGFFAATYQRGVPFVQVPTTLLAQVDASVGGKAGINWRHLKNYVGAFNHPNGVLIDTDTLQSLPSETFACGMAEVIKYACLEESVPDFHADTPLIQLLESHIDTLRQSPQLLEPVILRCCQLKAAVVQADPEERQGIREILNLGHTFGHAYETLSEGVIPHGYAVSMGMINAFALAAHLNQLEPQDLHRISGLLQRAGLPIEPPEAFSPDAVIAVMQQDKKTETQGALRLVLPYQRLGLVRVQSDVPPEAVRTVL